MDTKMLRRKTRPIIMVLVTAFIVMVHASISGAKNYAVLISAEKSTMDDHKYNSEFWYDLFLMYETLIDYGYTHQNIYVLYGDGSDSPYTLNGRYDASSQHPEWGIDQITDYSNDREYVDSIFTWLAEGDSAQGIPKMTEHDNLFVWWKGHGEGGGINMCLVIDSGTSEEEHIWDFEFANWVDQITEYRYKSFWFETCYSGGMIDNLSGYLVHTACEANYKAYAHNADKNGSWDTWHGNFSYFYISALHWQNPSGDSVDADANDNGLVSLWEAFRYADSKIAENRAFFPYDEKWEQYPQYSEYGYHVYLFSCGHLTRNTWLQLGDDMFFAGDVIVDPDVLLRIDAGVTVTFDSTYDDYDGGMGEYSSNLCELVVKGELVAHGNPENSPIYFQSSTNSDNTGEWYGIVFENTADDESELYGCVIKNAIYGIYDYSTNLNIEKNMIIYNQYIGIFCNSYASPTIYDNYIQFNNGHGIWCYYHSNPVVRHNLISDNNGWAVRCYVYSSPRLIGENSSKPYGANVVSNNGGGGVYCNSTSQPWLGYGMQDYAMGENTLADNTGYEVQSYYTGTVYAQYNYWGTGSTTYGNVDTSNPLPAPYPSVGPTWSSGYSSQMASLPEGLSSSQDFAFAKGLSGDIEEHIQRGLVHEGEGNYEEAIRAYRYVVDNYPLSEYGPLCFSRLIACRAAQGREALELGWLRTKAASIPDSPVGKLAALMVPLSMAQGGDFQGGVEECQRVALRYKGKDTQIVKEALFEMGHIYLFYMGDKQMAKQVFQELAKRFPGDELLEAAQELMGTFHSEGLRKKELDQKESTAPANCSLSQNYPNPGNPSTCITFILPQKAHVTLEIYNLLGQRVRTLVERVKDAGSHTVVWDGRDKSGNPLPSGVYLYRLRAGELVQTKKMLLLQ
mgnify:CR=1 FL=1